MTPLLGPSCFGLSCCLKSQLLDASLFFLHPPRMEPSGLFRTGSHWSDAVTAFESGLVCPLGQLLHTQHPI